MFEIIAQNITIYKLNMLIGWALRILFLVSRIKNERIVARCRTRAVQETLKYMLRFWLNYLQADSIYLLVVTYCDNLLVWSLCGHE